MSPSLQKDLDPRNGFLPFSQAGYTLLALPKCFSQNTLRNMKHSLYTFRISCEFRVLLMPRKNKPQNPLAGYILIVSCVSACSYTILWTILWDCEPITTHFSQYRQFWSSLILQETWRETCLIVLFDISRKYRSSGENGETRDEKNDWRDGLWNAIYTLLISLFLPTFFHVLVNLTISV